MSYEEIRTVGRESIQYLKNLNSRYKEKGRRSQIMYVQYRAQKPESERDLRIGREPDNRLVVICKMNGTLE